ncbi:DNA-binding transcriptional regulator, LysR family [Monaibacterium marinum]|uniref:DNA-binding transcriptional regulator, LysR family n=1 Tax=Pontivivens marinum TaxID=1690039 RepID=A0A2C9CT84_9RHOB|nr:LysR substrate-binding domain-containing protein [Monaibacterium marinum]SOH94375.1 DNA-binding transcriptional regulator, LysR family [Monaibacterium marinum]
MNLRSLRLFRDIVATGSLTEAASRANLSASSASRLLSQLEGQLQLQLFSRSKRNLKLTEQGALLYQQIQNTLNGLDEIPAIAKELRGQPRNWLSVITAAPVANGLAVPAIAHMRAQGVEFQCTIHTETRFEIESKVAARSYNLGLISLPVENEIVALDIMPLLRARICVLMPQDHPFAAQVEVSIKQLAQEPLVSLASGQRWRGRIEDVLGGAGLRPNIAFETGSTLVTIEMARQGLGLTIIDAVCMPEPSLHGMVLRPIEGDHWSTYASVQPEGPKTKLGELFLDALSAQVEARRAQSAQVADLLYLI